VCQKKVLKLTAIKFGQILCKIHTDTKKTTAGRCDFQGQRYWSLKIFSIQKFSAMLQFIFLYFAKKLAKQEVLVLEEETFVKTSQRASNTHGENLMALPRLWRIQ
jgi:hypothetical protein